MATVEIVTHCYSHDMPQYAALLQYQLSSLCLFPPRSETLVTVCFWPGDERTMRVMDEADEWFNGSEVTLSHMPLHRSHLFRRAIGRYYAAIGSKADVVWFTDCDHLFRNSVIDSLSGIFEEGQLPRLAFPRVHHKNVDHASGDKLIRQALEQGTDWPLDVDVSLFEQVSMRKAIGGLMIVPGDVAREGYANGTKWLRPVDEADGWQQCKCDVGYRKWLGAGGGEPIEIDGLYRIRHSKAGYE